MVVFWSKQAFLRQVATQPSYASWRSEVAQAIATLPQDAVLIGHSLGGSVLLKYLSEEAIEGRFAALFIVASPYWCGDDNWRYSEYLLQEDFAAKLPPIGQIFIYHSQDDEVVPQTHVALYAERGYSTRTGQLWSRFQAWCTEDSK